jgi:hypothetical protein
MVADQDWGYPLPRLTRRLVILPRALLLWPGPPPPCEHDGGECPAPSCQAPWAPGCCDTAGAVVTGTRRPLSRGDQGRSSPSPRVGERRQTPSDLQRDGDRPRPPRPTAPLQAGPQGEPPSRQPPLRPSRPPAVSPPAHREPSEAGGGHPRRRRPRPQGGDSASPAPSSAATAPRGCEARGRLGDAPRRSSAAHPQEGASVYG